RKPIRISPASTSMSSTYLNMNPEAEVSTSNSMTKGAYASGSSGVTESPQAVWTTRRDNPLSHLRCLKLEKCFMVLILQIARFTESWEHHLCCSDTRSPANRSLSSVCSLD